MLSYQSLMPAGAGTPRYENEAWSFEVFGCGWCHPSPLDSRFRENDEFGVRDMLSYQSPMPAAAGTPKYEKPELWLSTANWHGGFCHAPPRPLRGTSPRATFSHSAIGHRSTIRHASPVQSRHRG